MATISEGMFAVSAAWVTAVGTVKILVTNALLTQPGVLEEVNQGHCILYGQADACTKLKGLDDVVHMRVSMEKHIICCTVELHTQPVLASTTMQSASHSLRTLRHWTDDNLVAASPPS